MTKADIDLAHKLVGELGHCARAMDQYGNGRIGGIVRAAANLLEKLVEEHDGPNEIMSDDEVDRLIEAMKVRHKV
jgi:hypothetical protein